MSKKKAKHKKWLYRRQRKIMRGLVRKNKGRKHKANGSVEIKDRRGHEYRVKSPTSFSLVDYPEVTSHFFSEVFDVIHKCKKGQRIFFDLTDIRIVTADAIMYLLAVINNSRIINCFEIECRGNMPLDKDAREAFEKVGFYDHVHRIRTVREVKDNDRIKIVRGRESDGITTSNICDFVNERINADNTLYTKRLYPMLVELMTNVKQHAYREENGNMSARWYVYAENCDNIIRFVFLDTGVGIPSTIRKNWSEIMKDHLKGIIGGEKNDPIYIEAALNGEFRTETKQDNRGKGLPEIKEAIVSEESPLNNLVIISGHGICKVDKSDKIEKEYLETSLEGTLFIWCFEKEAI